MKSDRLHTRFLYSPKGELGSVVPFRALESGYERVKIAFGNSESIYSGENTSFGNSESVSEIQKNYKIIVF